MARTPMLHQLARCAEELRAAAALGIPVDELRDQRARAGARGDDDGAGRAEHAGDGWTRRQVLAGIAAGAASMLAPRALRAERRRPRIAIVGGGLAGLTAALELADRGHRSTLFEAQTIGGRVRSEGPRAPGCGHCHAVGLPSDATFADGQVTELYGEFIDSGHRTLRRLARRFGLALNDVGRAAPRGSTDTYHFAGRRYAAAAAEADFRALFPVLASDARAAGQVSCRASTPAGRALDDLSVHQWIETRVAGGHAAPFGQLLDVAYAIEYGADTRDQSALNLVYLLGGARREAFAIHGLSDERFQIAGGNQRLPHAIAAAIERACDVKLGAALSAITRRDSGDYLLEFSGHAPFLADAVLLALPFAALRAVDRSRAGFERGKEDAIRTLGAGRNGKVYAQFSRRRWNEPGPWGVSTGTAFSDTGFQATWDASRGQAGRSGILCKYTGGAGTASMKLDHPYGNAGNPAVAADVNAFLAELEPVFPGLPALWNGRASASQAHLSRYFGASYAYFRVGQYQRIAGCEATPQGGVFFAGEHTSSEFQGFMEGAVSEGARAGRAIAARFT